ncbi:DMT family transporter [Gordonia soli]|uniref:EamA domain-containing protein n=1 Tax=Gordonia soli NBRC 108243 TaxID=1223545 RepID=M0QG69_9ACTN|nr:EamA family transporter [Gordonia soli]GAC67439.1 hypothetical protein GS4_08_00230 [Gordonia soli NBRC 108243]
MTAEPHIDGDSAVDDASPGRSVYRSGRLTTVAGVIMAIGAAAAMGSTAPALKALAASELTPVNLIQARTAIGAVVLMTAAVALRRGRLGIAKRDWWLIAVYACISLAVNQVIFTMSLERLPVGVALLLEYTSPLLVALWMRWVQHVRLPRTAWIGIVIAVGGLALTAQVWAGFRLDALGVLLGLIAAVTMASRFLVAERGLMRYDPLVLAAWGSATAALALAVMTPLQPFPFRQLGGSVDLGIAGGMSIAVLLLWIGIIGMAGGMILGVVAQQRISPASANVILSLEVVVGTALAALLLDERLTGAQLSGAITMLVGIVIAQRGLSRVPRAGSSDRNARRLD